MRLWHWKLLPVLPDRFIISQWRECIAIKRQWEKGTLKHRLVSYVMNYPKYVFRNYVLDLIKEMDDRNIKYQEKYVSELINFCSGTELTFHQLFINYPEHNDRYLKQCLYNLDEKHDRGIISDKEWTKIEEFWDDFTREKLMEENDE